MPKLYLSRKLVSSRKVCIYIHALKVHLRPLNGRMCIYVSEDRFFSKSFSSMNRLFVFEK